MIYEKSEKIVASAPRATCDRLRNIASALTLAVANQNTMSAIKQRRRSYAVPKKLEVLDFLETHTHAQCAEKFGVATEDVASFRRVCQK